MGGWRSAGGARGGGVSSVEGMTDTAVSVTAVTAETAASAVTPAEREAAIAHFAAKLRYETDASDVAEALAAGEPLALVDTRSHAAWDQGHAVGAVHLPRAQVAARAPLEIPAGTPVVVYCWSPGCNGADKAALEFAKLGYDVKLMIGGFEYWAREGYDVESATGPVIRDVDALVGPVAVADCGC